MKLLPCPFCGGDAYTKEHAYMPTTLQTNREYQAYCGHCEASRDWIDEEHQAIKAWNTRNIAGHVVTFYWEQAGVIAPVDVWLVVHGCYMYGPCDKWQDVAKIVENEWEQDNNLVG
jgi:Lar family restriction alleviation protein